MGYRWACEGQGGHAWVHGPLPASFRPHLGGPEMGKEMRNRPMGAGMGPPWVCEVWGGRVEVRGPLPTSSRAQLDGLEMGKKMGG